MLALLCLTVSGAWAQGFPLRDGDTWDEDTNTLYVNTDFEEWEMEMSPYRNASDIVNLVISDDVTSIGESAFEGCTGLTSVTIGNSVTSIGDHAFAMCEGLKSVTIGNSVEYIGDYAFNNTGLTGELVIPNSVTSIEEGAFNLCYGLTSIEIPNSVESIGDYAFCYCTGLSSVTIPNSVISIGGYAFARCSSLSSVTIPNSVISIGQFAFKNCTGLTSVTNYATTPQTINSNVFENVNISSCTLYVPAESASTYSTALVWQDFGTKSAIPAAAYDITANLANGAYWATFYSNAGNYQAPEGTQVFTVHLEGTGITMNEVGDRIAKSCEGVVLKKTTTGNFTMTLTATTPAGDFTGNSLTGTMTDITNPSYGSVYVLNSTNGAGFYKLKSTGTIGANKAYLTYSGALAREFFLFGEATGIESIDHSPLTIDHSVYDLQGRRVAQPTKGVYIVRSAEGRLQGKNGKKVIK